MGRFKIQSLCAVTLSKADGIFKGKTITERNEKQKGSWHDPAQERQDGIEAKAVNKTMKA